MPATGLIFLLELLSVCCWFNQTYGEAVAVLSQLLIASYLKLGGSIIIVSK